jgi:hypothetical protein
MLLNPASLKIALNNRFRAIFLVRKCIFDEVYIAENSQLIEIAQFSTKPRRPETVILE